MKLQIFDRSTSSLKSNRISYCAVSFNRRNARATFTKQAAEELKIGEYQSVLFACDTDSKNNAWYLRLLKSDEGIAVRSKEGTGYCKGNVSYICTSRAMSRAILDSLKAKSGACLLISQNPVIIEGEEWYELITTKPIRIQ